MLANTKVAGNKITSNNCDYAYAIKNFSDILLNYNSKIATIPIIPKGIIIPYYSESIPDGWELFNPGDYILRCHNTDIGANSPISISTDTNSHVGNTYHETADKSNTVNSNSSYSHTHTIDIDIKPERLGICFIKSLDELESFPKNSMLFLPQNKYFGFKTFISKKPIAFSSLINEKPFEYNINISTDGAHQHGSRAGLLMYGDPSPNYCPIDGGEHSHTATLNESSSINFRRIALLCLIAERTITLFNDIIAFIDTLSIPNGWFICDGNNGTIDLIDSFIIFDNIHLFSKYGDFNQNIILNTDIQTHYHPGKGDNYDNPGYYSYHNDSVSHSHSATFSGEHFLKSYGLIPIMYKGG